MTDESYCPKCISVATRPSSLHEGMRECPKCGSGYFGTFESTPERMTERRFTALLKRELKPRANLLAGRWGLALAACGAILLVSTLPWLTVVGVVWLVLGWTAWKGRDL